MSEHNGELESTLIGIGLVGGATWFLVTTVIPWQPWLACTIVGLYLMLPDRMRKITESIRSLIKNGRK